MATLTSMAHAQSNDDPGLGGGPEQAAADTVQDDGIGEVSPGDDLGLDEIVVTASPLSRKASQIPGAVSVLEGEQLLQQQQPTLGETLRNVPGVGASYFGPGASRPVLRGLGGDRVQLLTDQLGVLDASAASADHAVAQDIVGVERIEILRGPAALRYGPNAVGGVVNTIENRVPQSLVDDGFEGAVELRGSSVDDGFGGAAVLRGSYENLSVRLKGFGFTADEVSIPGFAESDQLRRREEAEGDDEDDEEHARGEIPNSQVEYTGYSIGASWVDEDFFLGIALSNYETDYGVVFHGEGGHSHGEGAPGVEEPGPEIQLEANSIDVAGGIYEPFEAIQSIEARLRVTNYEHSEVEGDVTAVTFENDAYDLRIEAIHQPIGLFEGVIGFQSFFSDFDVSGLESFLPATHTTRNSLFVIEEADLAPVLLELGGRFDYATVESGGGAQFGDSDDRGFPLGSASAGAVYDFLPDQVLSFDLSWTMRAPNYEELYANGAHFATGLFEVGDRNLDPENALGLNLGWAGRYSIVDWSVNAFYTRFWDYIFLEGTGRERLGNEISEFVASDAEFAGGEVQVAVRALEHGLHRVRLIGRADGVYAQNLDQGDPLPRIPPVRFGGSLIYEYGSFRGVFDVLRAMEQDRVPKNEFTTDGYNMLDLGLSYLIDDYERVQPLLFFRIANLLDEEARVAESFLRDRAPLPGRNFTGGIQLRF